MGKLTPADGAVAGAWIVPELKGGWGSVAGVVPISYRAYARVLHPPLGPDGNDVTWADVADVMGRAVHPLVQWHAIVGQGAKWLGSEPDKGNLAASVLRPLIELLGQYTNDAARCYFGIWSGQSWSSVRAVHDDGTRKSEPFKSRRRSTDDLLFAFPAEEFERTRLHLPGREYAVLAGPLSAATQIAPPFPRSREEEEAALSPRSPNLIWPLDRAWFLGTEVDFDSTLIGGSSELVQAILSAPELEAWPVAPDDSLTWDSDKINPLPPQG